MRKKKNIYEHPQKRTKKKKEEEENWKHPEKDPHVHLKKIKK